MKKKTAQDSEKINKVKEKLQKKISANLEKVTQEALGKKRREIKEWIDRHSSFRVDIKE